MWEWGRREGEKVWSPGKLAEWAVAKEMLGLHGEVRTARATRASLGVPLEFACCFCTVHSLLSWESQFSGGS